MFLSWLRQTNSTGWCVATREEQRRACAAVRAEGLLWGTQPPRLTSGTPVCMKTESATLMMESNLHLTHLWSQRSDSNGSSRWFGIKSLGFFFFPGRKKEKCLLSHNNRGCVLKIRYAYKCCKYSKCVFFLLNLLFTLPRIKSPFQFARAAFCRCIHSKT